MTITVLILSGIVLLACILVYNSLIGKRNQAANAFATIDVMLKKRYDLIPNLVAIAGQYASHEKELFAQMAEMRSKSYAELSEGEKVELDKSFGKATQHIRVVAESYPDLKASHNFMQLQRVIHETEEQLAAARRAYNAAVTDYNTLVERFPSNLVAALFQFARKQVYRYNHDK